MLTYRCGACRLDDLQPFDHEIHHCDVSPWEAAVGQDHRDAEGPSPDQWASGPCPVHLSDNGLINNAEVLPFLRKRMGRLQPLSEAGRVAASTARFIHTARRRAHAAFGGKSPADRVPNVCGQYC